MNPAEIEAGRAFVREVIIVARRWRTKVDERLRALGMSQARYAALVRLAEHPEGLSQVTLADMAGVEPATLVRIIDFLSGEGLLERCPAPHDRRVNLLRLTPSGIAIVAELERVGIELGYEVLGGLPLEDLLVANSVLAQVRAKLNAP